MKNQQTDSMEAAMGRDKRTKPLEALGRFVPVPHRVIHSRAYRRLTHVARSLLWDMASQFRGDDNGRLLAGIAHMRKLGWKSSATLHRARKELEKAGFIYMTVQGHRPNKASWYALTWFPLDKLIGYDPGTEQGFRRWAFEVDCLNPPQG